MDGAPKVSAREISCLVAFKWQYRLDRFTRNGRKAAFFGLEEGREGGMTCPSHPFTTLYNSTARSLADLSL